MKHKQTIAVLPALLMVLGSLSGCRMTEDAHSDDRPAQAAGVVSVDDPAVLQASGSILTPELLEKAAENPAVTAEEHPRWTGFPLGEPGTRPQAIELCREWGFNSARVMLPYTTLFDREVKTADLDMLYR